VRNHQEVLTLKEEEFSPKEEVEEETTSLDATNVYS